MIKVLRKKAIDKQFYLSYHWTKLNIKNFHEGGTVNIVSGIK